MYYTSLNFVIKDGNPTLYKEHPTGPVRLATVGAAGDWNRKEEG